jgi:hypothetical protein
MKVSEFLKGALMLAVGTPVAMIVDWFGDLQDRERLRVINQKRKKRGQPPFDNLWQYYTSQRKNDTK